VIHFPSSMPTKNHLDRFIYGIISSLRDIWQDFGEPFPRTARFIRHKCIGQFWPTKMPEPPPADNKINEAAVIITSHNYGRYLADAIESVLAQTVNPKEIIVVDDFSTDETKEQAVKYSDKGVKYIYGEWHNAGEARNAGLKNSTAQFLVFLDADDVLHPEFIRCGLNALKNNPSAAIAYTDHQCFGKDSFRYRAPDPFDWERFDTENHFNSSDMVRREALLQAKGWSTSNLHHIDWITWRRILRLGWKAVKSNGLFFYRKHGSNMFPTLKEKASYAQRSGFLELPATLFIPLSGRKWAWPLTAKFLENQTLPHERIHLVIMDTSQDAEFGKIVREWLSGSDYPKITYLRETVGVKGLADQFRGDHSDDAARACSLIYNRFAHMCDTALALFLEDDVLPPLDAYERLIRNFDVKVISVSGTYMHRNRNSPVAWKISPSGFPEDINIGKGVAPVSGNGFGCLAARGAFIKHAVFHDGPPFRNFDQNFYNSLDPAKRYQALIDWDCLCRHYRSPDDYAFPQTQTAHSLAC